MSNETPAWLDDDRLTVKVAVTVPLLPSPIETSLIESVTCGAPLQALSADAELRGAGVAAVKSAPLLLVSVQPSPARSAAVAFVRPGAWVVSQAVEPEPYETLSTAPTAQVPVAVVVLARRATFPADPLMATVPVASGVGRFTVPPAPCAIWMR